MEIETPAATMASDELRRLLAATLSPDKASVDAAAAGLDRAAADPRFPLAILAVAAGDGDQGVRVAAATYLKNFTRRNIESSLSSPELYKEFRDQLAQALLRVEPAILRVLIEAFRQVVEKDFVKDNLWPELIPQLKLVIQSSNLISPGHHPEWNTINALKVLQSVVRPFQYFLNPKVAKEPVPQQLEQIAAEILVPLQVTFHHFADKVLLSPDGAKFEYEQLLLITCKCVYFTMPHIVNCAIKISKQCNNLSKLGSLPNRIFSLAFDVISRVLETGPGWRLVSPHFSSLLDSAIFPALSLNEKDIAEWEEDTEEYMQKNLPSELDEISGWTEDLFTARKSAINLLGVIALSKGPPVASAASKRKKGDKRKSERSSIGELLVIPFLSKFPIPSHGEDASSTGVRNYFGVLMAYGGLQDAMSTSIYNSLMKALSMEDVEDITCYPVCASASGAIAELIENSYAPPDWLVLLQAIVKRISTGDENESALLFKLLGTIVEGGQEKVLPHIPEIVSNIANTFVMRSVTCMEEAASMKVFELVPIWADTIANWDSWEEMEDQGVFNTIKEAINFHQRFDLTGFFLKMLSSQSENASLNAIEQVLNSYDDNGYAIFASSLAQVSSSSFSSGLSSESEIKLAVLTLSTVIERLLVLNMGATKDSEDDDVREETEEEFLERYALVAAGDTIKVVEEGDLDEETQDIELGLLLELFSG
nr:unnamed protein product [Digitaria exilis]